ncbi:hypothetical protein FLP41_08700 [Paracoccus marcusii]|uniref:hypothetical protein n=1 Tax=Paracoccus marcusii TaxID=59779 RepID=UPI002ED0B51F|nr:hypothetical protein FLP41_08700 [Paracoccus marcusii]
MGNSFGIMDPDVHGICTLYDTAPAPEKRRTPIAPDRIAAGPNCARPDQFRLNNGAVALIFLSLRIGHKGATP